MIQSSDTLSNLSIDMKKYRFVCGNQLKKKIELSIVASRNPRAPSTDSTRRRGAPGGSSPWEFSPPPLSFG